MKKIILLLMMSLFVLFGCTTESATEAKNEIVIWNSALVTEDPNNVIPDEEMPINKAISQFEEENPEYYVTLVNYSADEFNQALTAANQAKEGPDLVVMWAGSSTLAFQDYLLPLDEYLTEEEKEIYDRSSMTHVDFDFEKPMVAFPGSLSTTGIFYNKEIMEANNIDVENIKTWDEFLVAADTLKNAGTTPVCVGDADGYTSTWAFGELYIDLVGPQGISDLYTGQASINNEAAIEAMNAWKQLFDNEYTNPDWRSTKDGDAAEDFISGQCGFMIQGSWAISVFNMAEMGSSLGVIPFPAISSDAPYGDYVMSQPAINVGVTSYTEYPDASVELAKMLSTPEFIAEQDAVGTASAEASELLNEMSSWALEGKTAMGFDSAISGEAATQFYKLAPQAVAGEITMEEFFTDVASFE